MTIFSNVQEFDEKRLVESIDSIKCLSAQIRKMPHLTEQAKTVDQVLFQRRQDLKNTASVFVEQLNEQKKLFLQRFDRWILPIAQEVLNSFIRDAEHLKHKLHDKLDHLEETTPDEWEDQAQHWMQLYTQWQDHKGLVNKILEVVTDRTKQLIDKDIQVIRDYQTQSLAHLPQKSETLKNVEERLCQAIAEPLKQLNKLRHEVEEPTCLRQVSDWVAQLQERREVYFDQLLMKIDHVMKDVVQVEDKRDLSSFLEVEGEIIFMERELQHINTDISQIRCAQESDRQFLGARLEGLLDHMEDLQPETLPKSLKKRVDILKEGIATALLSLP